MHSESSPWQHLLWVPPKVYSSVRFDFGTSRAEETSEIICQMTQCTLPRFVLLFVWGFGGFKVSVGGWKGAFWVLLVKQYQFASAVPPFWITRAGLLLSKWEVM